MGGGHYGHGVCGGKNGAPPKHLWQNIAGTIKILDALRDELGSAIRISSAYRNEVYNECVGGEDNSIHISYNAIDFSTSGHEPKKVARNLVLKRNAGLFKGGIGIYQDENNYFVHLDTRGYNANFKGSKTSWAIFNEVFG